MVIIENVEMDNSLTCILTINRAFAMKLAEVLLRQCNSRNPNICETLFECDGEADLFKVAVV